MSLQPFFDDAELEAMSAIRRVMDDGELCNAQRWRIAEWVAARWPRDRAPGGAK